MKLKRALAPFLSEKELSHLIGSYDVVGDIAIVTIPEVLVAKERLIGRVILNMQKRIRVVVKRVGVYGGEFRTISLKVIAGENRKETEVKESGIRMKLNVEDVYYSVRSGGERRRVASLVSEGESVLVLFSGIAPYPLILSKFSGAKFITGVEKNPRAHAYAMENLRYNRKHSGNITLVEADAAAWLSACESTYDRLIMVLPNRGVYYLSAALNVLKPKGYLHFYDLQGRDNFRLTLENINRICVKKNRRIVLSSTVRCGHCSPKTYRICVDAELE